MKWGVRRNRRANLHAKVGTGNASISEKVRAGSNLGPIDFFKGGGFRGGSQRKGTRQLARNARVESGKASVADKLKFYGGTRQVDLLPTRKAATNTRNQYASAVAAAVVVSLGTGFVKKRLAAG
jgi:hypothetical protein